LLSVYKYMRPPALFELRACLISLRSPSLGKAGEALAQLVRQAESRKIRLDHLKMKLGIKAFGLGLDPGPAL
jgi:hypothetical protein